MIELERTDGVAVFVNPAHVVSIMPAPAHGGRVASVIQLTGDHTHHVFGATAEVAARLGGAAPRLGGAAMAPPAP